jgi:hypothetical protein
MRRWCNNAIPNIHSLFWVIWRKCHAGKLQLGFAGKKQAVSIVYYFAFYQFPIKPVAYGLKPAIGSALKIGSSMPCGITYNLGGTTSMCVFFAFLFQFAFYAPSRIARIQPQAVDHYHIKPRHIGQQPGASVSAEYCHLPRAGPNACMVKLSIPKNALSGRPGSLLPC